MKHTDITKQKIRAARLAYLARSGTSAWKAGAKHFSVPCQKWKDFLLSEKICFVEEFLPLKDDGRFFAIDIAFPDRKIGIEINGGQHYNTNGVLKPYYQNRHDLIEKAGWNLYEIPYHLAFDVVRIKEITRQILSSPQKVPFDFTLLPAKPKRIPKIVFRHAYPSIHSIKNYLSLGHSALQASIHFGIKYASFHAFLRKNGISTRAPRKLTPSELDPNWMHRPKLALRTKTRPCKERLMQLVSGFPLEHIGRMFDTTGNNIRKWCKSENITIPHNGRGFWKSKMVLPPEIESGPSGYLPKDV